ncbi:MAG TPA: hypothetical protein VEK57_10780 [Thermoanaerobaculia bacterium]|nr:hypothetical protein [Thermoanaerobaculia bacterium]
MHRRHLLVLVALVLLAVPSFASHAWGSYHWARQSNPFTLKVYDNVTSNWESYLSTAASDWSQSAVLDMNVIWQSPLTSARKCGSATGVIEICNTTYGQNGWLGIAGISISGNHITKGYTKLNDTYFNMATYNTPAYRQFVTCQELGHDFGLGHVNETFTDANTGSCMDYTNDPDGGAGGGSSSDPDNMNPNQHDFDMIASIYSHLDSTTTVGAIFRNIASESVRVKGIDEILADAGQWGMPVKFNDKGMPTVFVRAISGNHNGGDHDENFKGEVTHVLWVPEDPFEAIEEPKFPDVWDPLN